MTRQKAREQWHSLSTKQKLRQIWDYYKLPMVIIVLCLYVVCYAGYRRATDKECILYAAVINVVTDEELTNRLTGGYLDAAGEDPGKKKVMLYSNWYLTDDEESEYYQYVYASRMKTLAAIDAEQLDVVLMNREAFDAFAQNGYLADLSEILPDEVYEKYRDRAVENMEILEDNAQDVLLDQEEEYHSVTTEYEMALDVTDAQGLSGRKWSGNIYLGFLKNTPRREEAVDYMKYIFGE